MNNIFKFLALGVCGVVLVLTGCQVPIHEQRLVSKPGMQFSRNPALSYSSRIVPQILPGLDAGAEQASVCTICK
jgi:hypothetical protein